MTFNLMDYADSISESIDSSIESIYKVPYLFIIIFIILFLYNRLKEPIVPSIIIQFFDNIIFKIITISYISWKSKKNIQLSLILTYLYIYIIQLIEHQKQKEKANVIKSKI